MTRIGYVKTRIDMLIVEPPVTSVHYSVPYISVSSLHGLIVLEYNNAVKRDVTTTPYIIYTNRALHLRR